MAAGDPYRWTLDEYVLRCEQGPDICEVVAEGEVDRDFLEDAFRRWGMHEVTVLDSWYIDVEEEEVARAGFSWGAKGRLLTLGEALLGTAEQIAKVTVVVDRDYDEHLADHDVVLVTDGHSIESYAYSADALDRFCRLVLGRGDVPQGRDGVPERRITCTGEDLLGRIRDATIDIAAVRLVLRDTEARPGVFHRWTDYVRSLESGALHLDSERLLTNILDRVGARSELQDALTRLTASVDQVRADPFVLVRGHDFIALLGKLFRSTWGRRLAGNRFANGDSFLARVLLSSLNPDVLDRYPLFEQLQARFASDSAVG